MNGGIFDKLDDDNAKESIEDTVMSVPNFLFYGIETEENVAKGEAKKLEVSKVYHKGLNGIFKSYKFTLEENTPYDEDIALDPELLGLVFENLLAELDPNLEENTIKSIRKQIVESIFGNIWRPQNRLFDRRPRICGARVV